MQVGKRRDNHPIILIIEAGRAYQNGIKFYLGNEKVWLANGVLSQYNSKKIMMRKLSTLLTVVRAGFLCISILIKIYKNN